jgi:hypothetical protein
LLNEINASAAASPIVVTYAQTNFFINHFFLSFLFDE